MLTLWVLGGTLRPKLRETCYGSQNLMIHLNGQYFLCGGYFEGS